MNLQESIRRILREEEYSPAGKQVTPKKFVFHKSNPIFRNDIIENGLIAKVGECYQIYVNREQTKNDKVKCKPVIFATNSTKKTDWFDSTYDDDIWKINTEMIPDVKWYNDKHFGPKTKHILTLQDIPKEAITLIYEGTGQSEDMLQESRFNKMGEERYKSCSMSDITRMEIIDSFLTAAQKNPQFNIAEPDHNMLLDDWDGYDDQVYIQNKLKQGQIIFYEGWVDSCWNAIKNKPQYSGMNKDEVIEDIILNRFPRIGEEFNMVISDYGYFNNGDGYIMYVVFEKTNLQESIRRILRENSEEKISNYITKYVNSLLINNKQYCGFEITPPSKNTEVYKYLDSDSKPYSATLYLIGGYDTKYWPRTQAIKDKEFNLVADITLNIKSMFSVTVMIRVEHVKSCDETQNPIS